MWPRVEMTGTARHGWGTKGKLGQELKDENRRVQEMSETPLKGLQNRVPRFNSGRGLQAPMRRVSCAGTTMIVLVVSVAPRGSLNAAEHG
jgi:hypothetical protein